VRRALTSALRDYHAPEAAMHPDFFKVVDAAVRIAGTGSLGLERYAVLVEGHGSPDGNVILEVKEQPRRGAAAGLLDGYQYRRLAPAARVLLAHRLMQASSPAFLGAVELSLAPWPQLELPERTKSFRVKEMTPADGRLSLAAIQRDPEAVLDFIAATARLTAWAHYRSAGLRGMATPRELGRFAADERLFAEVLVAAEAYVERAVSDFEALRRYQAQNNTESRRRPEETAEK
jgi:uncharacterized protein (DUF2252 family)